jgi:hypothetical protein
MNEALPSEIPNAADWTTLQVASGNLLNLALLAVESVRSIADFAPGARCRAAPRLRRAPLRFRGNQAAGGSPPAVS